LTNGAFELAKYVTIVDAILINKNTSLFEVPTWAEDAVAQIKDRAIDHWVVKDNGLVYILNSLQFSKQFKPEEKMPCLVLPRPDPELCKFYKVESYPDLVNAMEHQIMKLQSKLAKLEKG